MWLASKNNAPNRSLVSLLTKTSYWSLPVTSKKTDPPRQTQHWDPARWPTTWWHPRVGDVMASQSIRGHVGSIALFFSSVKVVVVFPLQLCGIVYDFTCCRHEDGFQLMWNSLEQCSQRALLLSWCLEKRCATARNFVGESSARQNQVRADHHEYLVPQILRCRHCLGLKGSTPGRTENPCE